MENKKRNNFHLSQTVSHCVVRIINIDIFFNSTMFTGRTETTLALMVVVGGSYCKPIFDEEFACINKNNKNC